MAYAIDPNQQQQQPAPSGMAQTQAPVATSAAPGAGPTGSKVPSGAPTQQQSAQPFTNLQAYLTANQPQIQQEANTVSSGLTNQYGQVQNDINQGAQAFNQQVSAGYTPENAQVVQQAAANPAQFVQTPGNVQAFQSQINDQYAGPTNFEQTAGYSPINAEVTADAANADLVNNPAGLQTYLQGSTPNETQGDVMLDTALIGANPQAIQQVQGAAAPFAQLPSYLSQTVTAADAAAGAAPAAAQQAATDAAAAINPVATGFQNTLAGEVPAAQAQVNAYNQAINQNAEALNPINTALNSFEQASGVTGLTNPLTSYLNQQAYTGAPSLATTATPQQYAEDTALQQLMGSTYNPSLNQANIGQAGTFVAPTEQNANVPDLAQQVADIATTGAFTQQDIPNMQNFLNFYNSTTNPAFKALYAPEVKQMESDIATQGAPAQSQLLANSGVPTIPNYFGNYNPSQLESLLGYLSGLNPSGITKSGNNYVLNS